jgi:3-methyladenine DNA glycosylase AlkD
MIEQLVLNIQKDISDIKGRKTKDFRDIAKKYKKQITELRMEDIYQLCENILDHNQRGNTIVAYQIIYDQRKRYDENTFDVFEKWLYKYINDWWDCDDFMTHAFWDVLMKYPQNLPRIKNWVIHERFAVRRSAAVILIRPAQKKLIKSHLIFEICDLLIHDEHYLVQKGYGWLLKESVKQYHDDVIKYLKNNVQTMSRTAFRYALEKLPKEEKEALMKL